ncbi:MAG: tetratricopeptide repeat protein [Candidatus Marinimicrobia bacterium]|jgi:tetratricopeptide (TPR) repeat protein|nr:tetratricopeptide repeat protein [Candidatus Neomarinimicrobiota bacterium]MBT3839306.1 tetratricopeptide repeat protein [Candidatus Neomarinimicrobiota bacterium]MBT3998661.1 tetratricopeptide repeat protein [Candidatus Neomarinimicrobiota bacterium]MBT4382369.1 tetratricopeptide repeat protein [Candidatus Neomarinimicrobiota bacterium]MBT4579404.1 tetratricopeptide repeat protein [Candidatus Neomarinimicrobiota bacterium]
MRNKLIHIFLAFSFSFVNSQQTFQSVEKIKTGWNEYTSYQKDEIVSFCDFLFREGHYERCLLSSFQLLYKFPDDPISPVVHYYIARCYEEMENYDLAHRYYQLATQMGPKSSIVSVASNYRDLYISLIANESDDVLKKTKESKDPYYLTFRGYAQMKTMHWDEARTSFISAQSIFNHSHYNKLLTPIYQIIENVSLVPIHNKYLVFLAGMVFPGGGQLILQELDKGKGVIASVGLMALISSWTISEALNGNSRWLQSEGISVPVFNNFKEGPSSNNLIKRNKIPSTVSSSSNILSYYLPPVLIGTGLFIGSTLDSYFETQEKNRSMIEYYIQESIQNVSPSLFLDFPEPLLIQNTEINRK